MPVNKESKQMQWTKLIFEFVGKIFISAAIFVLVLVFLPELKGLLSKTTGVQAFGTTVRFKQSKVFKDDITLMELYYLIGAKMDSTSTVYVFSPSDRGLISAVYLLEQKELIEVLSVEIGEGDQEEEPLISLQLTNKGRAFMIELGLQ